MKNIPTELAKLHDIHSPEPISSWILAPGWYVLIALLIGLSAAFLYFLWKRRSQQQLRHHVLKTLSALKIAHQQKPNSQKTAAAISELLRQVALMRYPREQVAGLQGIAWLAFLDQTQRASSHNHTKKTIDFLCFQNALLNYPYQPPLPPKEAKTQLDPLLEAAGIWLNQQLLASPNRKRISLKRRRDV